MGFLFIILGTLMWSLDTLIRYPLLSVIRPASLVFSEHLILTAIFIPFLILTGFRFKRVTKTAWLSFFVIGVLGSGVATLAFTKAFSLINPSLVILLQKLQPLVAITFSSLILKEKISPGFYAYAGAALFGAVLVSFADIAPLLQVPVHSLTDLSETALMGYLLTLIAVLGWGASTVFGKKLSVEGFNEKEIMAGRFILGFGFLFIFCLFNQALPEAGLGTEIYLKILAMVLISGLVGMWLYYRGLKKVSAHAGAIAELFFPVSAVTINWIFLNKALQPLQIAGAAILILASLALQRRKL